LGNLVLITMIVVCAGYLIRMALIVSGVLKQPVLKRFERYSVFDDTYYPLPGFFFALGTLTLCAALFLRQMTDSTFPAHLPGLVLIGMGFVAMRAFGFAKRFPRVFFAYPRWYADLRERTTRDERRRLAYMWLALPRRARMFYSVHTWAFVIWADLVIVSTSTQSFEDVLRMARAARR
jgi:hypothetical protein